MSGIIYGVFSEQTCVYVGSTINFPMRKRQHLTDAKSPYRGGDFTVKILETIPEWIDLHTCETEWIQKLLAEKCPLRNRIVEMSPAGEMMCVIAVTMPVDLTELAQKRALELFGPRSFSRYVRSLIAADLARKSSSKPVSVPAGN